MAISLTKRPATISSSINSRSEYHGDDLVPACDFSLSGMMLERPELDELLGEGAYVRLFDAGNPNLAEPAFRDIKAIVISRKYEGGSVTLVIGTDETKIKIGGAKLNKITLSPQTGGLTALSLQVQCNPDAATMATLFERMGMPCDASIRFGREQAKPVKPQPELPLDHAGDPQVPATAH